MVNIIMLLFFIFGSFNSFAINKVDITKPIRIDADEININRNKNIMQFVGNVVVKQEQITINADKMIIYYETDKNNKIHIKNINAIKNVVLKNENMTAYGDNANYDFIKQFIILEGNVKLNEQDAVVVGNKMTYDVITEETKIFSNNSEDGNNNKKERVVIILDNIDNLKKKYDK